MSTPTLNSATSLVIFDDTKASNNPQFRFVDWRRTISLLPVSNPLVSRYTLSPGASQVIFNDARTTTIDNTTAFSIALNPGLSSIYRISAISGTAPGFRTDRGVNLSSVAVTLTVNNNSTVNLSVGSTLFGSVQVGDVVFIPGTLTGDSASVFSDLNTGYWSVIAKPSSSSLVLVRPNGAGFNGVTETQTPVSASQFQIFSSSGVQVGDILDISGGFSPVSQSSYVITNVTASWVEFAATQNLPLETGIQPTNTGMTFYSTAKRFIRVEVDQDSVVRFNGDTSFTNRVTPPPSNPGWFEKFGLAWKLEVVNRSTSNVLTVTVISAE